jgi:hypothetical protein
MAKAPNQVAIRTYQVGFGDCFLLSFGYGKGVEKHVLVDFGSTKLPPKAPKTRMMDIALDIEKRTKGKLHAVVATHRHQDHISGFATASGGKGPGDVIRRLKPDYVVQPWTEDPKLAPNATGPAIARASDDARHIATLSAMHDVARQSLLVGRQARYMDKELRGQLAFLGEDNIKNPLAVKNLMSMAKKKALYLNAGSPAAFDKDLGIKVHVLGPPTVKQFKGIKKQRSRDADQFWQFRAAAANFSTAGAGKNVSMLFPRYVHSHGPGYPINARWLVFHSRAIQGDQLLQIVRALDKAMNNTSVILLFELGDKRLLFPGDAQIENWEYALAQKKNKALLASINLYKVGHHGSLNATPKELWGLFKNRSTNKNARKRMSALMSTLEHKHGSEKTNTEVPRRTLVSALQRETNLFTTQALSGRSFFHETIVPLP